MFCLLQTRALEKALETFVVPYLCQKTELYLDVWMCGINTSSVTIHPGNLLTGHDLDTQTRSNFQRNAKKVLAIFQQSNDTRVVNFIKKMLGKHPNLTLEDLANNVGLAIAFLHNNKHGCIANDPELVQLLNPDVVVQHLKKWGSLKDQILLDAVKIFEEVTTC